MPSGIPAQPVDPELPPHLLAYCQAILDAVIADGAAALAALEEDFYRGLMQSDIPSLASTKRRLPWRVAAPDESPPR